LRSDGTSSHQSQDAYVLHAGTRRVNNQFVVQGGRVLNAVGIGDTLESSLQQAYRIADAIKWAGMQKRTDIGARVQPAQNSFKS